MQVAENKVVSIDYTLKNEGGEVLDSSDGRGPLAYLHGHGNIIPGLERAIEGQEQGADLSVSVPPEEAYGPYREELVQEVPLDAFSGVEQVEAGMRFQVQSQAGPMMIKVTQIEGENATVDGNHDLAGQTLDFQVSIRDIREATPEEIEQGQPNQS